MQKLIERALSLGYELRELRQLEKFPRTGQGYALIPKTSAAGCTKLFLSLDSLAAYLA